MAIQKSAVIITRKNLDEAMTIIRQAIESRMEQHGEHIASSIHEIMGIVKEEYDELSRELPNESPEAFRSELVDLAVASIYGAISVRKLFNLAY